MSQHFLLSSKAKTLRLADVLRLSDAEAETAFCKMRWQETAAEPVCQTRIDARGGDARTRRQE